jgi:hypothetical protein
MSFTTGYSQVISGLASGIIAVGRHTHSINTSTGDGGSHDHSIPNTGNASAGLPPYNAVKFIMRIK